MRETREEETITGWKLGSLEWTWRGTAGSPWPGPMACGGEGSGDGCADRVRTRVEGQGGQAGSRLLPRLQLCVPSLGAAGWEATTCPTFSGLRGSRGQEGAPGKEAAQADWVEVASGRVPDRWPGLAGTVASCSHSLPSAQGTTL